MKLITTKALAKTVSVSPAFLLKHFGKIGLEPEMQYGTVGGRTVRLWGPDALKAAKQFRQEIDDRASLRSQLGIKSQFADPYAVAARQAEAELRKQSETTAIESINAQLAEIRTVLGQILDHITPPLLRPEPPAGGDLAQFLAANLPTDD